MTAFSDDRAASGPTPHAAVDPAVDPPVDPPVDPAVDRRLERRTSLRNRHAQSLTRLMDERADLRGVHALADFVDDAVRWTA